MDSIYKQVKRRSLPDEVANQIHDLVRQGHFKANDQLPGERELAELLNVNRSTLREALRILEVMRVVDIRQGEGTFVNIREESSIESVVFQFMYQDGLDLDSLEDVYEAVYFVEAAMTKLAAQRITDEEKEQLKAYLESDHPELDNAKWDRDFHQLIGKIAKSNVMFRIVNTNWIIIEKYAGILFERPGARQIAEKHHRVLVDMILNGRADAAHQFMQDHFHWAHDTLFANSTIADRPLREL
ncbi:MAG: FadR/GntR family transcriptional regulator [Solirubrobacterales bacterium]